MLLRLALAAVAGAALSFAYSPHSLWWIAPLSVAALSGAVRELSIPRGFLLGWVFGLGLFLPLLSWLGAVIGRDAGIGLSVYSALWLGAVGAGTAAVTRLSFWPLWTACVWVLFEAVSGRIPFGGWGWGRLGFASESAPWLPWAGVAGVPGLTFLVALLGAGLAWLALDRGPVRARAIGGAAIAAVVVVAVLWPVPTSPQDIAGPAQRQVGLIQGNVPRAGLDFNAQRREVLDNHVRQTLYLAEDVAAGEYPQPDFVLWPENAADIDPFRNDDARAAIDAAARAIGAPLLVGAVLDDPDDDRYVYNVGIVWDPVTGPGDSYTKRNLVPFGEYVPFRGVLASVISRFDRVPRDFVAGTEPGDLDIGGTRIGDAICFDVAYDDALRQATRAGGRMLVVQTNNATYNGTEQTAQQLAMSRIRAVEHGRAVAVVATSGLSAVINPDGSIMPGTYLGELTDGRYVVAIPQRDTLTLADRWGPLPEALASIAGAVAIVLGWRRGRGVSEVTDDGGEAAGSRGRTTPKDSEAT